MEKNITKNTSIILASDCKKNEKIIKCVRKAIKLKFNNEKKENLKISMIMTARMGFRNKPKNEIKGNLDLKTLKEKNLISKKYKKLKILGSGEIKKNIEISAHFASKQALAKIEKAGGKISLVKK